MLSEVGGRSVIDGPLLIGVLTIAPSGEGGDYTAASAEISTGKRERVWVRLCLPGVWKIS